MAKSTDGYGRDVLDAEKAVELDARPIPEVTYEPFGDLFVGHQLKLTKIGKVLLPSSGNELKKQYDTIRVKVLAAGPDCKKVKVGDVVLVGDAAPAEVIMHRGQLTVVMKDDHVFGKEKPDEVQEA